MRALCEDGLISTNQRRLSLEAGRIAEHYKVPPDTLERLVDQRLLRAEPRLGSLYYELSHDTLVRPILADRAEREARQARRRRRVILSGSAVLLLVVAIGVIAWLLRSERGEAPSVALGIGAGIDDDVESPGDVARFTIEDRQQSAQVVVEPTVAADGSGLNSALAVTSSSGARRTQDQLGGGAIERIILPAGDAGGSDLEVSSNDQSTGRFHITLSDVDVARLGPSDRQTGTVGEPGAVAVYRIEGGDDDASFQIDVTPSQTLSTDLEPLGPKPETKRQLLDAEIEVIDGSGVGRRIDDSGAGLPETVTLAQPGRGGLIVVRGYQASTGDFEIHATKLEQRVLAIGEVATSRLDADHPTAEFAIEVPDGSQSIVVSSDVGLDTVLSVTDPRNSTQTVDSGGSGQPETLRLTTPGRHLLRVTGFQGGVGTFRLGAVAPQPMQVGQPVTTSAPALFTVDVRDGDVFSFTARADAGGHVDVQVLGSDGFPVGMPPFAMSSTSDGPASAFVGGGQSGTYQVLVDADDGAFTATLDPAELRQLDIGGTTSSTPAIFDLEIKGDELYAVTADPDGQDLIGIVVTGPDGYPTGPSPFATSSSPGQAATAFVGGSPGHYSVMLTSMGGATSAAVSVAAPDIEPLGVGEAVSAQLPAVFEVAVRSDVYTFTATPDIDRTLEIVVTTPQGFASPTGVLGAGGPARAFVGNGTRGTYRVSVTSPVEGATYITAELDTADELELRAGEAVTITGPTVVNVDVGDGELFTFVAQGDGAFDVAALGPSGFAMSMAAFASSTGPEVSALVGGESSGTYRVMVTPAPDARLTATLRPIAVQPLAPGPSVTTGLPAAFDVDIIDHAPLTFTATTETSAALSIMVLGPDGVVDFGSSFGVSSIPGQPATARASARA